MTLGNDIRAIWIASVPRTGSMWTFNVARELVRGTGRTVLPETVPQDDAEMESVGRAGIAAGDGTYVLKVHTPIDPALPHSVFVVTRRDLHDSMVSFMRFTHADFEAGLRFVAGAIRLEQHYATLPAARTLHLDYAEIIGQPAAVVGRLAGRLGISLPPEQAAAIVSRFSKTQVQARLIGREQALRDRIAARQPVDRREFVQQADRSLRAFDMETGFQSGHVSDYREGDWRHMLSDGQKARLDALIAEGRDWQARQH